MLYDSKTRDTYRRARSIVVDNPVDTYPNIRFHEELAIVEDGVVIGAGRTESVIGQSLTEENIGESFDLVHPVTGDVIGSATYGDLQVILTSLYLHLATAPVVEEIVEDPALATEPEGELE